MKVLCKTIMFLTLLIFCVGSVCATDPDNNITDNYNSTQDFKDIRVIIDNLEKNDVNQGNEIQQLKDSNTQLDKRVKALEESNKQLVESNKALNSKLDNQTVIINNQSVIINSLKTDNEALNVKIDNQNSIINNQSVIINNQNSIINELNNTVNNQSVIINSLKTDNEALNAKLDLQLIEIKQLNVDKDKLQADIKQLNAEKCTIYEKLLESPKKEDYEQLKKDITNKNKDIINKDNKIKELNTKIKILNNILNINKKDVCNSLKALSTTNIQNIKCGSYTFSLDEYLKIPLIKYGKDRVLKYKKTHGRLPNYVTIAGYDVPKNVYKKLFSIK